MAAKTFLPGLAIIVKHLCRYTLKYATQIDGAITACSASTSEKATLRAFIASVAAACLILDVVTGY